MEWSHVTDDVAAVVAENLMTDDSEVEDEYYDFGDARNILAVGMAKFEPQLYRLLADKEKASVGENLPLDGVPLLHPAQLFL